MRKFITLLLSCSLLSISLSAQAKPKFTFDGYSLIIPSNWTVTKQDDYAVLTQNGTGSICQAYLLKNVPSQETLSTQFSQYWQTMNQRSIFSSQSPAPKLQQNGANQLASGFSKNTRESGILDVLILKEFPDRVDAIAVKTSNTKCLSDITNLLTGSKVARRPKPASNPQPERQTPNPGSSNQPQSANGKGIKDTQIYGIYLHLEYSGVAAEYNPYLLLKNGTIFKNVNVAPGDLDPSQSKQSEPEKWGTWKISGKTLNITWNDGKTASWGDNWLRTFPARENDKLNGNYRSLGGGNDTAMGGSTVTFDSNQILFSPNGTFTQETAVGGSSGGNAASSRGGANGTYKIKGHTIELRYGNGSLVRKTFYFYPSKGQKTDDAIGIGNSSFSKRK